MCQNNVSFSSSHFYFSENDENNINKMLYLPKEPWSSQCQRCGFDCCENICSHVGGNLASSAQRYLPLKPQHYPDQKPRKNKHRRTQRSILELTEERAFSQKQSSHFPRHVWTYDAFHIPLTQKMCSFKCSTWWSPWFFTFRCREMAQWHCTVG